MSVQRRQFTIAAAASLAAAATPARAQETVLRAVSAFPEQTAQSLHFEKFIERVNATGKGVLRINYVGGPRAVPSFELGNAVKTGVVDIANANGGFYASVFPEADALKLAQVTIQELRRNGGIDTINRIWNAKGNMQYVAMVYAHSPFYLYLNRRIAGPAELAGMKIRISPLYRDFLTAIGVQVVNVAPGEIYAALERGVVDGYGWPMNSIFDLGWHEKTKYRVEPGFYNAETSIIMNLDAYKRLSPAQRQVFDAAVLWVEALNEDYKAVNAREEKRQADAGIQVIRFEGEDGRLFVRRAYDEGWKGIIARSPDNGPALRRVLAPAS